MIFKNNKLKINNESLWVTMTIVAVVLIGLFAIGVIETGKETSGEKLRNSVSEVIDTNGDKLDEFGEEVKDQIDDNMDLR